MDRAHEIAATIAAKPPSATQGTVKAIWESLDKPYRAAMDQGLIYTRLGNPLGEAELAAQKNSGGESAAQDSQDPLMPSYPLRQRIADVLALRPERTRSSTTANGSPGDGSAHGAPDRRPAAEHRTRRRDHAAQSPGQVAALLGVLLGGGTVVVINPSRGDERTRADIAGARLPLSSVNTTI